MKLETATIKLMDSFRQEYPDAPLDISFLVERYIKMAYGVGYDEGKRQNNHAKEIYMYRNDVYIRTFESISSAADYLDVHKSNISRIVDEKGTCKGYHFKRRKI